MKPKQLARIPHWVRTTEKSDHGIVAGCARPRSGHPTAAPPITLMKSRRRIAFLKA
jgi:hypothetical protein